MTFNVKIWNHVAKLFHMLSKVRLTGDVLQSSEALLRKSCCHTGKLVDGPQFGEPTTGKAEIGKVLGLVWWRSWRRLKALLRKV